MTCFWRASGEADSVGMKPPLAIAYLLDTDWPVLLAQITEQMVGEG